MNPNHDKLGKFTTGGSGSGGGGGGKAKAASTQHGMSVKVDLNTPAGANLFSSALRAGAVTPVAAAHKAVAAQPRSAVQKSFHPVNAVATAKAQGRAAAPISMKVDTSTPAGAALFSSALRAGVVKAVPAKANLGGTTRVNSGGRKGFDVGVGGFRKHLPNSPKNFAGANRPRKGK